MDQRNIVITGVPRSGTTLTCHLLNKLPDVVALHEPIAFGKLHHVDEACREVDRFFNMTRESLIEHGQAISKQIDGHVPDNHVVEIEPAGPLEPNRLSGEKSQRKSGATRASIEVGKPLSADFLLCIKHPAAFTALLKRLVPHYPCYAIVRNPLAVLGSWNSLPFSVSRGRAPAAERFDAGLAQALGSIQDLLDRQLHLLSWFFETYRFTLPPEHVLRYENVVDSGGKAYQVITAQAAELDERLENKNKSKLYDRELTLGMGEKLLKADGAFWDFYTKASVESLLNDLMLA